MWEGRKHFSGRFPEVPGSGEELSEGFIAWAVAAAPTAAVNSNTSSPAVKLLPELDFTNALQVVLAIHLISAGITSQDPSPFI